MDVVASEDGWIGDEGNGCTGRISDLVLALLLTDGVYLACLSRRDWGIVRVIYIVCPSVCPGE